MANKQEYVVIPDAEKKENDIDLVKILNKFDLEEENSKPIKIVTGKNIIDNKNENL